MLGSGVVSAEASAIFDGGVKRLLSDPEGFRRKGSLFVVSDVELLVLLGALVS